MPTEPSTALITNDIVGLGLIAATLAVIFWAASGPTPLLKKIFAWVPAQNTTSSFGPSFMMPFRSIESVSSTSAAGNSTSRAIGLYSEVLWPSIKPAVL